MDNILLGISEIFQFWNLFALFLGVLIGFTAGALPGINANITIAVLIPFTFGMDPQTSMMLLCGVYCSSSFSGSFPAVLLGIPGTASAVVTTFDGYPMTKKGEGGIALGVSTVSSVLGGIISGIILVSIAPFLASQALKFGPPEYFSLTILGFCTVAGMSQQGGAIKNLISMVFGLLIATVGMDPQSGFSRYTFGITDLIDGFQLVPMLIGLFGVSAVLELSQQSDKKALDEAKIPKVSRIMPDFSTFKRILPIIIISAILGSLIGIIPGAGMIMAIYLAYHIAKQLYKKKKFGEGIAEGVAAPESANNAVAGSSMVPLLSLGIPGNSVSALLIGALMIHGLRPGPSFFTKTPEIAYLLVLGFIVSYIFIFPIGIFVAKFLSQTILKISSDFLNGIIIILCLTGSFAINNNIFDVWVAVLFGLIGFVFNKLEVSLSPLVLAIVLGS